jgi:hypothetical protein
MRKFLTVLTLIMLIAPFSFGDEITTGDWYHFLEYDGTIIWYNLEKCRVLEIIPINQSIGKIVIDIPVNKAGNFNTYTWYFEIGKSISMQSDLLQFGAYRDKQYPESWKYLIETIIYNKIKLKVRK